MEDLLLLYSHCMIVEGAARSAICDLQRKNIHLIPIALARLFTDRRYIDIPALRSQLDEEARLVLETYLDFLQAHELAFTANEGALELFPEMSEEWLFPANISNCVLDTEQDFDYFNESFLDQLTTQGCHFIQFRCFGELSLARLRQLMDIINLSPVKSVEIVMPGQTDKDFYEQLILLVQQNPKISCCTLSSTDEDRTLLEGANGMGYILKTKSRIDHAHHCGVIDKRLFSVNIATYTESLAYNKPTIPALTAR
jgi:hypothetical protein